MGREKQLDFCIECRKETEFEITKVIETEIIRDKKYNFEFTAAVCKECGARMDIPGFLDLNIKERDEQYRKAENIISVEEIVKLMELYHIGKAPLSLALGFGEVTISRYLEGQMPSKKYSDIMSNALSSPKYMEMLLDKNRGKIGETAFKKAMKAVEDLKHLFQISDKMQCCIAYIFEQMQEVTPLALQKMLYYIQGIYMVLFDAPIFSENCCAWQHGPVYEKVYFMFKDFKFNPIDDNRFVLLKGKAGELSDNEKMVIDLVIKSFGNYSGKVLEKITHNEKPWQDARKEYNINRGSNVTIPKDEIHSYFKEVSKNYGVNSVEGLKVYIHAQLTSAYS